MPFRWTINPYRGCSHACVYCFARPTHTYLDMDAGRDFEQQIVVKVNVPEVLRAELSRPSWTHEHVAMGTNTDPYQWVEGRYRLMPRDLGRAARHGDAVLRADEVPAAAARPPAAAGDRSGDRRVREPLGPDPRREGVAGDGAPHAQPARPARGRRRSTRPASPRGSSSRRSCPGSTTRPSRSRRSSSSPRDAGATSVGGITLHLRGEVRGIFLDWLRSQRPDLVPRYEELYARGAYAPKAERERIEAVLRRGRTRFRSFTRDGPGRLRRAPAARRPATPPPAAARRSGGRRGAGDGRRRRPRGTGAPLQDSLF